MQYYYQRKHNHPRHYLITIMLKRILLFASIPLSVFLIFKLVSFTDVVVIPEREGPPPDHSYRVYSLVIPQDLNFAGEPVPVDNFEVRERFDRELLVNSYWQSQTILFFKRANRWFPLIEPILAEEGIPDDFKYLALIESGLMNVVSPAGAAGYWQILQTTGRELGLEVNTEVDERYDVEKSTRAAAKFLRNAYNHYQSWTSAAAAYNMGRAGFNRMISNQKQQSYYDLWLNDETSRYVFRILAIKTIFEDPLQYGFALSQDDLYQPYEYYTVQVNAPTVDWVEFSHQHQITYKELRTLNPWIRRSELNNSRRKTYDVFITRESLYGRDQQIIVREEDLQDDTMLPDAP